MSIFKKERLDIERLSREDDYRKQMLREYREKDKARREVEQIKRFEANEQRNRSGWASRPMVIKNGSSGVSKKEKRKLKEVTPRRSSTPFPKLFFR